MSASVIEHRHEPLYRVVRQSWNDPLDTSFSREKTKNRWNTAEFPALYCCCSERVARFVTLDLFRYMGVDLTDLQPPKRPQLVEIGWCGTVVDMASTDGITTAGFGAEYPAGVANAKTQEAGSAWHAEGKTGVVCRSASVHRQGLLEWIGPHERWSEIAVFVNNCEAPPSLLQRRIDQAWLVNI